MDQGIDISYYVGVVRRRWPLVAIPTIVCATLSTLVAFVLPPTYSSKARLLVESQQIPEDLARSTVTASPIERIRLIEQRLTARENMLALARDFNVFDPQRPMTPTGVVNSMREATTIASAALGSQGRRGGGSVTATALEISFTARRPDIAARVTNELVTQLLEENVEQRTGRASDTLAFFDQEVTRLTNQLTLIEQRITAFQIENAQVLPESLALHRQELATLRERLFQTESRIATLQAERDRLEQDLRSGRRSVIARSGMSPAEQELERLRGALLQQRAVFADSHPTIRSLLARISAIERSLSESAASAVAALDVEQAEPGPEETQAEPAPASPEISLAIAQIDDELAQLRRRAEADAARIESLDAWVARGPEVDVELQRLLRTRDLLKAQSQQASLKRAEAEIGQRLEVNQRAERFEVIEAAQVPDRPISPNRPLIAAAGIVVGGGLGVALMLLVELLNRCIRTPGDLIRTLDLRPIVTVPYIHTAAELRRRRWMLRGGLATAAVVAPLTLFIIDQQVAPLPTLADRMMRATGLEGFAHMVDARFGR